VAQRKTPQLAAGAFGQAFQAEAPYDNPDGTPLRIDTDYFGNQRTAQTSIGPFDAQEAGPQTVTVWPLRTASPAGLPYA
jgi:alpha-N-arabinofuranosidase